MHGLFDVLAVKIYGRVGITVDQITGKPQRVALQRTLEGYQVRIETWICTVRGKVRGVPYVAVRVDGGIEVLGGLDLGRRELVDVGIAIIHITTRLVDRGQLGHERTVVAQDIVVLFDERVYDSLRLDPSEFSDRRVVGQCA